MRRYLFLLVIAPQFWGCTAQTNSEGSIEPGANHLSEYLPLLKGKKVSLFVNHTSLVGQTHLADTLLALDINVTKIFTPEHGFRGTEADGELIEDETSGHPFEMISLYGERKKPTKEDLSDIDVLVIDIQDVGVRFYTYASTMTYLMEACARDKIPVILLDRPNPNGSYVDGPVLKKEFKSFIGLHPIPLVHGLTLGELAMMINDERWLGHGIYCQLTVITVRNWDHGTPYSLPVKPSPNLPNDLAIALYPSLGLFEGTVISVGRGTDHPFQVAGHPGLKKMSYSFKPEPNAGSKYPPQEGKTCYGKSFMEDSIEYAFTLKYLLKFYQELEEKIEKPFFNNYFSYLAGTDQLRKQIEAGLTESEIRASWQEELAGYRELRKKYLLYE